MIIEDRNIRQEGILNAEKLAQNPVTIVGVGAIGRQVAIQLTTIGVPILQLFDFDRVEPANLGVQGFLEKDLGKYKTDAVSDLLVQINSEVEIDKQCRKYGRSVPVNPVVFCCVDSIQTRKHIWNAVKRDVSLFIDARMASETIRIVSIDCLRGDPEYYEKTLFESADAFVGECTTKSTLYAACIAAGLCLSQFSQYLRGFKIEPDIQLNLLSSEMIVG